MGRWLSKSALEVCEAFMAKDANAVSAFRPAGEDYAEITSWRVSAWEYPA
ncbi:hypothetical protein ACNKHQ_15265 [Shigella flexneri]